MKKVTESVVFWSAVILSCIFSSLHKKKAQEKVNDFATRLIFPASINR